NADSPAVATTSVSARANLDASAAVPTAAWDPTNPSAGSNFSNSVTVYDSLGAAHQVDLYYRKTADNTWEYHAFEGATEVGAAAGGTLVFNTDGTLQTHTPANV